MWKQIEEKHRERAQLYMQVIQLIRERGAISRVEIAKAMQATRASISLLIQEMLEKEFLEEVGVTPMNHGKKGRRNKLLAIHPSQWLLLGVSVDEKGIVIGLTTLGMKPLEKQYISVSTMETTCKDLRSRLQVAVQRILERNYLEPCRILGLGIGLFPSVLQHIFPDAAIREQRIAIVQKEMSEELQMPVFLGDALPSMASYWLYQFPEQEKTALFCADGGSYYVMPVCRDYTGNILRDKPILLDDFPLSLTETVGTLLTHSALIQRVTPYYHAEQTPELYRLTRGKLETLTLPMLFTAASAEGQAQDVCLVSLLEELLQQFCQLWSSIFILYNIRRLYLYRRDFTLPHWQEIQYYARKYMPAELAERLSCGDLTEKCQYAGGIFYAFDGGMQEIAAVSLSNTESHAKEEIATVTDEVFA